MTNERKIDRIVNNTFEEIDAILKLINIFEIFKQEKIEPTMQNMIIKFFFQSALLCPICLCLLCMQLIFNYECLVYIHSLDFLVNSHLTFNIT